MKKHASSNDVFKGSIIADVYAYSLDNEILGCFKIGKCRGIKKDIFVKYCPVDDVDCQKNIVTFKVISDVKEFSKMLWEELRNQIEEVRKANPSKEMMYAGIIDAICPESSAIYVPLGGFVTITNNFIINCISDNWVRIESLFSIETLELYSKMR